MKKLIVITGFIALVLLIVSTTSVRETTLVSNLTVIENIISPVTSSRWVINGLDENFRFYDGGARNDVDNVYSDTLINDGTLDLTSLTNTLNESLDLTGETIMAIKFSLEDDSAATCIISQGGSNPYPLLGTTYSFTIKANQSILFKCDTVLDVVASDAKTIAYNSSNDSTVLSIILISADSYE